MFSSVIWVIRGFIIWMYIASKLGIQAENLALHKPAWMSSLHVRAGIDSLDAPNAVDGRITSDWFDGVCTHTDSYDTSPWIVVDLLAEYYVTDLILYNRQDCCYQRLHDFVIEVFKTNPTRCPSAKSSICKNYTGVFLAVYGSVACDTPVLGRYVRIWKPTIDEPGDVLSLCEIIVFGEQKEFAPTFLWTLNDKRFISTNVTSLSARSAMSCVMACGVNGACVGVNYNTKNEVCELLTRPEPGDTVSDQQDWVYCGNDLC